VTHAQAHRLLGDLRIGFPALSLALRAEPAQRPAEGFSVECRIDQLNHFDLYELFQLVRYPPTPSRPPNDPNPSDSWAGHIRVDPVDLPDDPPRVWLVVS
jgi:hypothetical protein